MIPVKSEDFLLSLDLRSSHSSSRACSFRSRLQSNRIVVLTQFYPLSTSRLLLLAGCGSDLAGGWGAGGGDGWGQRGPPVHPRGHLRRGQTVRFGPGGFQVRHRRVPAGEVYVLWRTEALNRADAGTIPLVPEEECGLGAVFTCCGSEGLEAAKQSGNILLIHQNTEREVLTRFCLLPSLISDINVLLIGSATRVIS